ncbi:MAG: indole-3-glycerol phosphate synthase TrpC [Oceanococcus sp.]|nr:MAG: indole-3-glycerol phosphate synthase TrpC [Oceanococcus sp.]
MSSVLDKILAHKADEVRVAKKAISLAGLAELAEQQSAPRGFEAAMNTAISARRSAVISELKKASPSKGLIRDDFDPPFLADSYARGGATCLSILTDEAFFQGHADFLVAARAACELPVLRKDFMIDPYQMAQSRAWGADCILLIVAALSDAQMNELYAAARESALDVLVEVHDGTELERALQLPGGLLGINNRNLKTFETSLNTTLDLLADVPSGRDIVTESGIHGAEDMHLMREAGVYGFLIGEHLMRKPDPGAALAAWLQDQDFATA